MDGRDGAQVLRVLVGRRKTAAARDIRLPSVRSGFEAWGNKWGNMPHRSQPIPADLDLAKPLEI
jgi:hypothetical protein